MASKDVSVRRSSRKISVKSARGTLCISPRKKIVKTQTLNNVPTSDKTDDDKLITKGKRKSKKDEAFGSLSKIENYIPTSSCGKITDESDESHSAATLNISPINGDQICNVAKNLDDKGDSQIIEDAANASCSKRKLERSFDESSHQQLNSKTLKMTCELVDPMLNDKSEIKDKVGNIPSKKDERKGINPLLGLLLTQNPQGIVVPVGDFNTVSERGTVDSDYLKADNENKEMVEKNNTIQNIVQQRTNMEDTALASNNAVNTQSISVSSAAGSVIESVPRQTTDADTVQECVCIIDPTQKSCLSNTYTVESPQYTTSEMTQMSCLSTTNTVESTQYTTSDVNGLSNMNTVESTRYTTSDINGLSNKNTVESTQYTTSDINGLPNTNTVESTQYTTAVVNGLSNKNTVQSTQYTTSEVNGLSNTNIVESTQYTSDINGLSNKNTVKSTQYTSDHNGLSNKNTVQSTPYTTSDVNGLSNTNTVESTQYTSDVNGTTILSHTDSSTSEIVAKSVTGTSYQTQTTVIGHYESTQYTSDINGLSNKNTVKSTQYTSDHNGLSNKNTVQSTPYTTSDVNGLSNTNTVESTQYTSDVNGTTILSHTDSSTSEIVAKSVTGTSYQTQTTVIGIQTRNTNVEEKIIVEGNNQNQVSTQALEENQVWQTLTHVPVSEYPADESSNYTVLYTANQNPEGNVVVSRDDLDGGNIDENIHVEGDLVVEPSQRNTGEKGIGLPIVRTKIGYRKPVSNIDIDREGKTAKGVQKPAEQILIMPEFVELMSKLEPDADMGEHVIIYEQDAPYPKDYRKKLCMQCKYCSTYIKSKHHFRRHIITHSEVNFKPWKCPLCDYRALIKATIKKHINVHSEVKPYICNECGRGFNFKQKLQLHMKYHRDEREFYCPCCVLSFHELKTLKNHVMFVHQIKNATAFLKTQNYRSPNDMHLATNHNLNNPEIVYGKGMKFSKFQKLKRFSKLSTDSQSNPQDYSENQILGDQFKNGSTNFSNLAQASNENECNDESDEDNDEGEEVIYDQREIASSQEIASSKEIKPEVPSTQSSINITSTDVPGQGTLSTDVPGQGTLSTDVPGQGTWSQDSDTLGIEAPNIVQQDGQFQKENIINIVPISKIESSNIENMSIEHSVISEDKTPGETTTDSSNFVKTINTNLDPEQNSKDTFVASNTLVTNFKSLLPQINKTVGAKTSGKKIEFKTEDKIPSLKFFASDKCMIKPVAYIKGVLPQQGEKQPKIVYIKLPPNVKIVKKSPSKSEVVSGKSKPSPIAVKGTMIDTKYEGDKLPALQFLSCFTKKKDDEKSPDLFLSDLRNKASLVPDSKDVVTSVTASLASIANDMSTTAQTNRKDRLHYETSDSECEESDDAMLDTSDSIPHETNIETAFPTENDSADVFDASTTSDQCEGDQSGNNLEDANKLKVEEGNELVLVTPRTKRSKMHGTHKISAKTKFHRNSDSSQKNPNNVDKNMFRKKVHPNRHKAASVHDSVKEYIIFETHPDTGSSIFTCAICEQDNSFKGSFKTYTHFMEHLFVRHPSVKPFKCESCSYICRTLSNLISHKKCHNDVLEYVCKICKKGFRFNQKLKVHLRVHENKRSHGCNLCPLAFNERCDLNRHFKKVHMKEKNCRCPHCPKQFFSITDLRRHVESHNDEKTYLCEYCNKMYQTKLSLLSHMKSHTCMFHCEICNRDFGSYSGFMAHKVMHDESSDGYDCEVCHRILTTKGSLKRHMQGCHSDERPWECKRCDKAFKSKKDLNAHGLSHQNERVYVCEVCNFQSKRMDSLKVHMRRHSVIKPYQCGVCWKDYTQKSSLEQHMVTHTGESFKCEICQACYPTRNALSHHMLKQHVPENLKEEVKKSGNMTVYMCEQCKSVFVSQDFLAVHIMSEHMKQGLDSSYTNPSLNPNLTSSLSIGVNTEDSDNVEYEVITEGTEETIPLPLPTDDNFNSGRLVSLLNPLGVRNKVPAAVDEISSGETKVAVENDASQVVGCSSYSGDEDTIMERPENESLKQTQYVHDNTHNSNSTIVETLEITLADGESSSNYEHVTAVDGSQHVVVGDDT